MPEQFVSKDSEFKDGDRRIVFVGDREIGVFKEEGQYYAYSNICLHQGGPACEGLIIAKVEERIMPDKTSRGLYFSDTERHFVCPWHGYEYDIKTGEFVGDRKRGRPDALAPEALQNVMAAICRAYRAQIDAGQDHLPLPRATIVAPTDVMVTCGALLRAADLQVFELGMWQSFTGR